MFYEPLKFLPWAENCSKQSILMELFYQVGIDKNSKIVIFILSYSYDLYGSDSTRFFNFI